MAEHGNTPEMLKEAIAAVTRTYIVKVQFLSSSGEPAGREYAYRTVGTLSVGDKIDAPTQRGSVHAVVTAINVPESEIEAFKDRVTTIPAGSVIGYTESDVTCETSAEVEADWQALGRTDEEKSGSEETAIALRPGADAEVMAHHEEGKKMLAVAEKFVITEAGDTNRVTEDLALIAIIRKAMDAKRKALLNPLKTQSDAIRDTYSYLMNPILEAERIYKGLLASWDAKQREIRHQQEEINRKRMEAAQQEAALNNGEISESVKLVEVAPEQKPIKTEVGTAGMVANWKYEITDPTLLPREYMMPDTTLLTNTAKKYHDQKPVPGVKFYNEPYVAVRGR